MLKAVFNILGSALGASSVSFACYPGVDLCMCLSFFLALGDAMKESEKTKREMNIYLSLSLSKKSRLRRVGYLFGLLAYLQIG